MVDGIKKVLRKVLDTVMSPIREVKTSAQGSGMHASIFLANFDADAQLFRHDVPVHALLAVGTGDCVVLMPEIGRVLHDLVKIRSCRDNNLTAIFPWWRNLLIEFVIRCTRVIDLRVSAGADLERVGIAVDQICGSLERGHFLLVREVLPLFAHFDFFLSTFLAECQLGGLFLSLAGGLGFLHNFRLGGALLAFLRPCDGLAHGQWLH
mmetsp:Transcript_35711/g.80396  ORF Transcript_35711/g.80396 Transcript_35711/m.80396 type:complete len:208 (-) Transcript_35711:631-1254(-)